MTKIQNEQEAIEQAIKVGYGRKRWMRWRKGFSRPEAWSGGDDLDFIELSNILTDPLFWRALGKARGWHENEWSVRADGWFWMKMQKPGWYTSKNFWSSLP